MKTKESIYIAGKITGEPIIECTAKFIKAKTRLWSENFKEVINPLSLHGITFGISHEEAMRICLEALSKCSYAYFLNDWKESKGAQIEHQFCKDNNITIYYEDNGKYLQQ